MNEINQETLSSGAPCFIPKPIEPSDLNSKHDLNHKINDGSKKIQDDTDGPKKIQETTSSSDPCDGDSSSKATQKFKVKWTETLDDQFNKAIQYIGIHKVTPKKILKFMNLKFPTISHISSRLQKHRKNLRVKGEGVKQTRMAMYPKVSSTGGYINPQNSYNYNTRLGNKNPFIVQPGYGLGQSSSMMNNNAGLHDSLNYMNRRPAYDLSQSGCNLFPGRGNYGFQNGMLPLKEEGRSIPGTSQVPSSGQYGTAGNGLSINYNPTTGNMGSNNYAGIIRDENGHLVGPGGIRFNGNGSFSGARVHGTGSGSLQRMSAHGNGHGSLGGIKFHGNDNGIRVHDTSNGYGSFGGVKVHGTGNSNGFPDGIIGHGNNNSNDSFSGTRVHGTDTGYVGGVNVHGTSNGNGSLGMNWNFNNNMSNHGSSISMFPYALPSFLDNKDQSQNNLIAQTSGVIPAKNPNLFNDHHDINEVFPDTNNYQFYQNQHQGNLTRENLEAPTAYPLEDTSSWNFRDGTNNEEILNSLAANPEMYRPTQDMNITNQGNTDEEILNSLAANPEMYFPTQDMNITNQGNNHDETLNSLAANPEIYFPTQDMNITNQDYDDEEFLNYLVDPDKN